MIKYHKGDLFELAPKGAYLAHACNCQGVWGSGIAKQFKERFPLAFEMYKHSLNSGYGEPGDSFLLSNNIIVLLTSLDYGDKVDSPKTIIENTRTALLQIDSIKNLTEIWMPKINSGLFRVPWEETEKVLNEFPEIIFNVCEL